jgi:hypothetical protein
MVVEWQEGMAMTKADRDRLQVLAPVIHAVEDIVSKMYDDYFSSHKVHTRQDHDLGTILVSLNRARQMMEGK